MSSAALKALALQLQAVANKPAEFGGLLTRVLSKRPTDIQAFQQVELAIARVADDTKRNTLATLLYRWMDVHRLWLSQKPDPACSVYTACVPFTVKDLTLLKDPNQLLYQFTGPLDTAFSDGVRDALFLPHVPLVLVVPLVGLRFADRWALNFMLANSHMDTPADQAYSQLWTEFIEQEHRPEQLVFGYLFSVAVPRPSGIAPGPGPVELPMTPFAQQALTKIEAHAQSLNAAHPALGMELQPLSSLSEAVDAASDLRFAHLFTEWRDRIGAVQSFISPEAAELGGLSLEEAEEIAAQLREAHEGHEMPREEAFGQVVMALSGFDTDTGASVLLQVSVMSRQGQLMVSLNLMVPLNTNAEQMRQWWALADPEGLAEVVILPFEHVTDTQRLLTGYVRDAQGRWLERELLNWGPEATDVFKTAKWTAAFGATSIGEVTPGEQLRKPVLQTFEDLNFMKAVQAHYQPKFVESLKRYLAVPGMSRKLAYQHLCGQFETLRRISFKDTFNAFTPSSMWAALHHEAAKGVLFRVHASVQEQMSLTDVENRFPLQLLHSPYPDIYLHLESQEAFEDSNGAPMMLEGAFISERMVGDPALDENPEMRGTRELTLTVVLNDQRTAVSLHYPTVSFLIGPQDDRDLAQMLRDSAEQAAEKLAEEHGRQALVEQTHRAVTQPLLAIAKLLLYVSLPDARLDKQLRRSELMAQARAATGRERQRLFDKASRESDRILVGPLLALDGSEELAYGGEGSRTVRPHSRRGYIRTQRHGEGLKLTKPVWIRPVMVNQRLLGHGQVTAPKVYDVR